jgi:hypothetical protein
MRTLPVSRASVSGFAVLLALFALPARAAPASPPSRLSLLAACGGGALSAEEERLRAELELALDGFDVVVVDPGRVDFPALSEAEQIAAIRVATSNAADNSPALWLECGAPERLVVRLLVTEGGVPYVRALSGAVFEEIALIVREIATATPSLPTEPAPPRGGPPGAAPPPRDPPAKEEPSRIAIGVLSGVELSGGLVGQVGPSFQGGAGIAVDARLAIGFFGRAALLGKVGPRSEEGEFLIAGQRIEPRVELGYLWDVGHLAIGPVVGLSFFVSFVDFVIDEGYHQRARWWSVRFASGFDSRWLLTERLSIALDLTSGFMPSKRFYRRSSGATLLETPTMDLAGMLGVIVRI